MTKHDDRRTQIESRLLRLTAAHGPMPGAEKIASYLLRLTAALGPMPGAEKEEILSDIRNHIEERASDAITGGTAGTIAETITSLGSPERLAASYHRERLLARATASPDPTLLLHATFQWARTTLKGFLALLVLLLGYGLGLGFLVCAFLKPFMPHEIGLWRDPPAFSLGYLNPAERHAQDLLGLWIIPVGYVIGPLLLIGTMHLVQWLLHQQLLHSRSTLESLGEKS
jgi:hypothetical protein